MKKIIQFIEELGLNVDDVMLSHETGLLYILTKDNLDAELILQADLPRMQ